MLVTRQWSKVYDLCHTFLHIVLVRKHTFSVQFSHGRVFSDSHNVQKRLTKSDTSGHCLLVTVMDKLSFYCDKYR